MTELEKSREEWIEKNCNSNALESHRARQAWNACIEQLSKAAGEFDQEAALQKAHKMWSKAHPVMSVAGILAAMAHWQFDQDGARIGLAEQAADHHIKYYQEERAKVRELEARLAESSASQLKLAFKFDKAVDRAISAETRLRELECRMDPKWLADKFISWPLPASVRVDLCAREQNFPHRSGTNLLTWDEARQMFKHVLEVK